MKEERFGAALKNGIIVNNPSLVQLFGLCPALAVSTTMVNAIGMGLSVTLVLIASNFVISLLGKIIPDKIRIASYIVITAGFVTVIDMLLQAYLPALSDSLGLFIPLIVVNCIILARTESFASENKPLPSVFDGFAMGIGFTFLLCALAVIREILGAGTFFGIRLFGGAAPVSVFALPAGGFLALGFVVAIVRYFKGRREEKGGNN